MSEANNVWRVQIEGTDHEIELDHANTLKEKVTITVDGQTVEEGSSWRSAQEYEFAVAGQQASIKIDGKYGGMAFGSSLYVDGRYVEPLER